MSNIENNNETNNNVNNSPSIEIKENNDKNIIKMNTLLSNYENEKTREETIRENKTKKHVSFVKPVYTLIDVESYKKYNEDISETRFYYYGTEMRKSKYKKGINCGCLLF